MSGLKSWNFWTPINGTLYGWRAYHPDDYLLLLQGANIKPRVIYAYGGKTTQHPWTKRIEQHAWGRGRYDNKPQPWVDTVLGWTPNGTVTQLIAAGGVFTIWQGRTVMLLLSWGEILIAIKLRRPYYNHQWNQGNRRRIPIPVAEDQRELRDTLRGPKSPIPTRRRPQSTSRAGSTSWTHSMVMAFPTARRAANIPLWIGYYRRWLTLLVLSGLVVLFWPGMPGADTAVGVRDWVSGHRNELIACVVFGTALVLAGPQMLKPQPRRRRTRRYRR
jgi:hypothetical protein